MEKLQSVSGKDAAGIPQLLVFTDVPEYWTSFGTEELPLSQKYILMKVDVRSIAYHPPPIPLKSGPKLLMSLVCTPHPELFVSYTSQFVPVLVPVMFLESGIVQLALVCSDDRLGL